VGGTDKPTLIKYYDTSGTLITTVTISYNADGDPVWNGDTLKGHHFNVFSAAFEIPAIDPRVTAKDNMLRESNEQKILEQLKKINIYFSIITNTRL
jgi:hypothetical protein